MKWVSLDTETTGLNPWIGDRPFAYSFCFPGGKTKYLRGGVDPYTRVVGMPIGIRWVREILLDSSIDKVFHNASFDIHMLEAMGLKIKGRIWDTMVMSHVQDSSRRLALKPLAEKLCGILQDDEKDLQKDTIRARREGKKKGWALAESVKADYWMSNPDLCRQYSLMDAVRTARLFQYFREIYSSDDEYREIVDMELSVLQVTIQMERNGIKVDKKLLSKLDLYYHSIVNKNKIRKKELGYEYLNPRSPVQMKKVFYSDLNLPSEFVTRKGKNGDRKPTLTCDALRLQKWANQGVGIAGVLVNINTASHQINSFIKPLLNLVDDNDVVHPNFNVVGPITGRLSCYNPNLQNLTNTGEAKYTKDVDMRVRGVFVPRPNHVLYMPDFSQIEVWLAAFLSGDDVMKSALLEGRDMHGEFAEDFFGKRSDWDEKHDKYRKRTKNGTFCTIYGGGNEQLANTLLLEIEDAGEWKAVFWERYFGLAEYAHALSSLAEELGSIVDPFGRKYIVPKKTPYVALNYMIQGSAAGIMKRALISVAKLISEYPGIKMMLTIHDEIIMDVPKKYHSKRLMRSIIRAMQGKLNEIFEIPVPFPVSMSWSPHRWSRKYKVDLKESHADN